MRKILLLSLLILAALTLTAGALAEDMPLDPYRADELAQLLSGEIYPKGETFTLTLTTPEDKLHPSWQAVASGGSGSYTYYFQFSRQDSSMAGGLDLIATSHGYKDSDCFSLDMAASGSYEMRVWAKDSAGASSYARQVFEVSDPSLPTIEARVAEIAEACRAAGCETDFDIALWVHDWLTANARYDYTYSNYGADGVLLRGTGVCDSYAAAYMHLLTELGLTCKHISGTGNGGSHAWNAVKLDGCWYWIDVTWDDPGESVSAVSGSENHMYFGLPTEAFCVDHTPKDVPSDPFNHYEDNYFIHTGRVSMWTNLFSGKITETLDGGLYRAALAIPDRYPSERTGYVSRGKEYIVYRVTAYALSAMRWQADGASWAMDVRYDPDATQVVAALRFESGALTLPSALTEVPEEAFDGDAALTSVTLGDGVRSIGPNAFRDCAGLWRVYVPASVTSIDPSAFSGCHHVTLAGPTGSYAETFAGQYRLPFVAE